MRCYRFILKFILFAVIVFTYETVSADCERQILFEPNNLVIEYGAPLGITLKLMLCEPSIFPPTGKPRQAFRFQGPSLQVKDVNTGKTTVFHYDMGLKFYLENFEGLKYKTNLVIWFGEAWENREVAKRIVFDKPGTYSLSFCMKDRTLSNTLIVKVKDSPSGKKALSILKEPNDITFLTTGLCESPDTISTLEELVKRCQGTVLAKWAAARLGLTYFEEFQRRQPSFKKAAELYKQGRLEDGSFKAAYSYLRQATELPDEFPIRSEALGELVELLCVTGELDDALKLSGELVNKYPHTEHGKKARLWEKELAELGQAEQIRQAAPDPNKLAGNNEGRGNWQRWLVLAGAVGVAIAAGVVLVVLLRKKPRAK